MALKPIFGTGAGANGFGEKHVFNEFFTHLEMTPLPLKGCKFSPMLSTDCH